ncbi:MAG TPA: 6-pyruvoyl-tetrahydropterin synthase-related protein [Anaerolineae bacterium]|nr:6-pyruvoyl-tetrahydropterin synthase-related protein [Anaerolineae bacterium]
MKKMAMRNCGGPNFYVLLLVLSLGLLTAWPFISQAGLPRGTDAELHVLRIAELGYSLRAGNLYPRWAPDFYHGYGYPIFNYYAPLTYHLGNWITFLRPENAAVGAKTLFVLSHLLGAAGAYFLGREFGRQGGGLLGSAVFAFSPYIMLVNPHIRGDLAEVFALALVPWALWFWELLWRGGGRRAMVGAVMLAAGTLLSHNLTGLTLMTLLLLLSIWHWLILRQYAQFWQALFAGILVMALTAYFWLPFVVEQHYVQLENVAGEGHYDFREHYVPLSELLAFTPRQDWRATVPQIPMSIGPLIGLLAIAGIVIAVSRRGLRRILFYGFTGAACFGLITQSSIFVWENLPGMHFYQFPWRFLGPFAALIVPLVASIGLLDLSERLRSIILSFCLALVVLTALPGLYMIPWENGFADPLTPLAYIAIEQEGRWRGTTSTNDFVPTTVEMLPSPQDTLLESYETGAIDRVNRYTVPQDATVEVVPSLPWRNHFKIQTATKFVLRLYLFYFPGWQAYLDGKPTEIEVAHPEGFITVKVPPGDHEVLIQFEDTLPRKLGWAIAGIAGIGWGGWLIYASRKTQQQAMSTAFASSDNSLRWLALTTVGLLMMAALMDNTGWLHYTSPSGEARPAQYTQQANFDGEIALLGFDLSAQRLQPGNQIAVTLYWNAQRPLTETYQSFVHLVYPEGQIWTQSDHLNPAGFPTNLWPTERYVQDTHYLQLPQNIPPGQYYLSVGLYTLHNQQRLLIDTESGGRVDNIILLHPLIVK